MTLKVSLSFRAQNLDNTNDDIIVKDGETLDPSEKKARQKVVSKIYSVVSSKTKVMSAQDITIYCRNSDFVIEAIPVEDDFRNRKAPVVIYGKLPEEWSEYWGSHVRSQIKDFVKNINRTLENKTLDAINAGLKKAYDRKERTESLKDWLIKLGVAVIIPLLMGWLLQIQIPQLFEQSKTSPSPQSKTSPSPQSKTSPSPQSKTSPSPQPKTSPSPQPKTSPSPQSKTSPSPQSKTSLQEQPQVTHAILQTVIQRLIMQIACWFAINNVLILILSKLRLPRS